MVHPPSFFFFFFNDTATTEIYTLSLHDALPICIRVVWLGAVGIGATALLDAHHPATGELSLRLQDRKSTRLNSSHDQISYAVFCLKKKKKKHENYFFLSVQRLLNDTTD